MVVWSFVMGIASNELLAEESQQTGQSLIELNKSKQIADIYGANNKDLAMWKAGNTGTAVAEPKLDANYARQAYQSLRSRNCRYCPPEMADQTSERNSRTASPNCCTIRLAHAAKSIPAS